MDTIHFPEKLLPPDVLKDVLTMKNILQNHGARKIILYGSMARGDFTSVSDIDLCVEGLPDRDYFRALAECLMLSNRRISIIDLNQASGYFRENILREGKVIHES